MLVLVLLLVLLLVLVLGLLLVLLLLFLATSERRHGMLGIKLQRFLNLRYWSMGGETKYPVE